MPYIAVCKFPTSNRTYDYLSEVPVEPGQRAYVDTKRGKAEVEIVGTKEHSDIASVYLLAVVPPKDSDQKKAPF